MRTNGRSGRARRLPEVLLGIAVVTALVATVLLTAGGASPAVALAPNGHWVFNRAEGSVVHVDGGTDKVDARVAVPDAPREPGLTLQSPTQGFLVGRQSVTVFGKSTLTVETTVPTGQDEMPVGIEVTGGPYLVYRQAGTIVRLGSKPTSIPVGGPVERPVYTDDGTVWLHRPDNGTLCALRAGAATLDCALQTEPGPSGALAVTGAQAAFLSTARDAIEPITDGALGTAVPAGADVPSGALVADRDTRGRLPALSGTSMQLLDSAGVGQGRSGAAPVPVALGPGTYTSPVTSDGVVAVIEQTRNHLLTFSVDGRVLSDVALPPGEGPASITRGADGRIYVDDADGGSTHLVQPDGSVTSVRTGAPPDAVQAASADRASLVTPPPPRSGSGSGGVPGQGGQLGPIGRGGVTTQLPGRGTQPVGQPGPGPVPPERLQPPQPPVEAPDAPKDFVALPRDDGSVDTGWVSSSSSNVRHEVRAGGQTAQFRFTSGNTAKVTGLTAGRPVTLTVVAIGTGGASSSSNAVTVTPKGGAVDVAAPGGFTAARRNASGSTMIQLNWTAPALNGATLVGYEVNGGGFSETVNGTQTVDSTNYCTPSVTYTVRAIVRPSGGGDQTKSKAATTTVSDPVDCTPDLTLSDASAQSPTTASFSAYCVVNARGGGDGNATITLRFNGRRVWSGPCEDGEAGGMVGGPITGLTPGTTYSVTGTVSSKSGSKPAENTLTVTTPAQ